MSGPKKPPKFSNATNAFTARAFCDRNALSLSTFRKMIKAGRGPRLTFIGPSKSLITLKAEQDWLKAIEHPDAATLALREAEAVLRKAKSKVAGLNAAASPNHVSKRNVKQARARRAS
jgi:hypothetical protein